jgi:KDO2-lipid IV(A) lauroyltransferase
MGPARAAAVGGALGRFAFDVVRIRRQLVERQIAAAFPERDAAWVRARAREAYDNLGRVAVESVLRAGEAGDSVVSAFTDDGDWDVVRRAHAQGRGVAFLGGHLGNWELVGAYLAQRLGGVHAIYRGVANPFVDAYFRDVRERLGMHLIRDRESVRVVPRVFRDGGAVGFLSDQSAVGLASTYVPFFGRPARTPRGAAVFAIRFGVPVVATHAIRQPDGRYRFVAEDVPVPATGDRERDVDGLMLAFNRILERLVRENPGQYFWHHRRWKYQPADTPEHLRGP